MANPGNMNRQIKAAKEAMAAAQRVAEKAGFKTWQEYLAAKDKKAAS